MSAHIMLSWLRTVNKKAYCIMSLDMIQEYKGSLYGSVIYMSPTKQSFIVRLILMLNSTWQLTTLFPGRTLSSSQKPTAIITFGISFHIAISQWLVPMALSISKEFLVDLMMHLASCIMLHTSSIIHHLVCIMYLVIWFIDYA